MNRRELMKSVLAGATVASSGLAQAPKAAADTWKPLFFDAHQNETVIAVSELIIPATDTPGAKAALANRYIDLMLSESPSETQRGFLEGIAWLDGLALRAHHAPFVRCTTAQQTAMLKSLDPDGKPAAELRLGSEFFRDIKARTVDGYYTSKIGYDELNKGGRVQATTGCHHTSHPNA